MYSSTLQLFDNQGFRKYLNTQERQTFYQQASTSKQEIKLFCEMLYFTGARISEVLNMKVRHLDKTELLVNVESLKKKKERNL